MTVPYEARSGCLPSVGDTRVPDDVIGLTACQIRDDAEASGAAVFTPD